jgi:16S rRNA (cytosine967-C5)-methyltransferase
MKTEGRSGDREPGWAWWTKPVADLPLRHAARIFARAGAFETLVFEPGAPLDRALQEYQRSKRALGRTDRLLLGTAVYGLARNRELLREALPRAARGSGDFLLLALLDAVCARPAVELAEVAPALREAMERLGHLRRACVQAIEEAWRAPAGEVPRPAAAAFARLFSVPESWLEMGPWETLGDAAGELAVLKRPQHLALRAQNHRTDRERVLAALSELSIPARPTARSPWGVLVEGRHNLLATELFRSGDVEVQDEGSQLAACLCDPKPSEKVLDLCAGGGGKSLALAAMMGGRGQVIAHDAHAGRLADTKRRARKSGLGNIRCVEDEKLVETLGPYDLVLVDAPCSSTGTLRRNPDVAWRWSREAIERLAALQASLLDRAASLVAPGGTLVYVTCSVLRPENDDQVTAFLGRQPEFEPHPPGDRKAHAPLLDIPGADTGAFRLAANLPDYAGDAFFCARFRRIGGQPR